MNRTIILYCKRMHVHKWLPLAVRVTIIGKIKVIAYLEVDILYIYFSLTVYYIVLSFVVW